MKTDIISSDFIKPSSPTPSTLKTHKLSFFDQIAPLVHPGILFLFPSNTEQHRAEEEISRKLNQLKKSLSLVLTRYYPFAGSFVKDDSLVDCNDQGVLFLEARVRGRLDQVDYVNPDPDFLYGLVPRVEAMVSSGLSPVLAIQVSIFACSGIAVGFRISHKIADGYTEIAFMKEWATANKDGGIDDEAATPSFELGLVFPSRDLSVLPPIPPLQCKKVVAQKLEIDEHNISILKEKATCPDSGRQPSKVVTVSALIWRTLIQISQSKNDGKLRDSLFTITVDLRGRCGVEASKASLGNFYCVADARFEAAKNELELHELAKLIKEGITKTSEEYAKARNTEDIFTKLVESEEAVAEKSGDMDIYDFSSLGRFSCYEIDFGWGKPVWMTVIPPSTVELVWILESKSTSGIEVWLTLNEYDMAQFRCHQDILAVSSLCSLPNRNS